MNYIYIILACFIAGFMYYVQATINQLDHDNTELRTSLSHATQANESYRVTLEQIQNDYAKGLEVLSDMRKEKQKEVRYVTQIKEKIIHDNNSTCIDAINAIYARLHEQRDSNKQAIRNAKD
ncbi:hypothetical protein [Campylobacter fetus]|uniref:hypothetical protein n=1 Tax=Campylobacter fetus TaxID=196 RepID=UPI0013D74F66|nr:hypothetical protein [Campylobacter fetus]